MIHRLELKLSPADAASSESIRAAALKGTKISVDDPKIFVVQRRRSIDARSRKPHVLVAAEVYVNEKIVEPPPITSSYKTVDETKRVIIVGAGPAGYFAALELIELGMKPVVV